MSSSLTGKKAPFTSLRFLFLYKKQKIGWASQSDLWASQPFCLPNVSFFPKNPFTNVLNYNKADRSSCEEGSTWFPKNFFHAAASAARPSNELGSKKMNV